MKDKEEKVARYSKPTEEEGEKYSTFIWEAMNKRQEENWSKEKKLEELLEACKNLHLKKKLKNLGKRQHNEILLNTLFLFILMKFLKILFDSVRKSGS